MRNFHFRHDWILSAIPDGIPIEVESILGYACLECHRVSQNMMTTGHLLLGLIRSTEGIAICNDDDKTTALRRGRTALSKHRSTETCEPENKSWINTIDAVITPSTFVDECLELTVPRRTDCERHSEPASLVLQFMRVHTRCDGHHLLNMILRDTSWCLP